MSETGGGHGSHQEHSHKDHSGNEGFIGSLKGFIIETLQPENLTKEAYETANKAGGGGDFAKEAAGGAQEVISATVTLGTNTSGKSKGASAGGGHGH
jgi:hypothetical protein